MSIVPRIAASLPRAALPRVFRVPTTLVRGYRATPCFLQAGGGGGARPEPGSSIVRGRPEEETPDRRPVEAPQDTFTSLNVYEDIPPPGSAIDTIVHNGFVFSNGVRFYDGSGALLVDNEIFKWRPTERGSEVERKALKTGILELGPDVWGMLDVVNPKPELLIVGTGRKTLLLSKQDRNQLTELGIRMDVMDTTHAAAQYNLLATERSPNEIAAALLVDGFGSTE